VVHLAAVERLLLVAVIVILVAGELATSAVCRLPECRRFGGSE
jgi:hypothetical protein